MPTPECWEDLGRLKTQVDELLRQNIDYQKRIAVLEGDRIKVKTIGGICAFLLTGLGVYFSEPVRKMFMALFLR